MEALITAMVSIIVALLASGGFWTYIQSRKNKKDAKTEILIGIAHDRICFLGMQFINRGWVRKSEFENLIKYIYEPYKELGGNGTAEQIINKVKGLEIKPDWYGGNDDDVDEQSL